MLNPQPDRGVFIPLSYDELASFMRNIEQRFVSLGEDSDRNRNSILELQRRIDQLRSELDKAGKAQQEPGDKNVAVLEGTTAREFYEALSKSSDPRIIRAMTKLPSRSLPTVNHLVIQFPRFDPDFDLPSREVIEQRLRGLAPSS